MFRDGEELSKTDPTVVTFDNFCANGRAQIDNVEKRLREIQDDDLATLIYTSGTTGPPKGVMLSHKNLAWTAQCVQGLCDLGPSDSAVSYLPLSHIAEQMTSIHLPITAGYEVWFAGGLDKVREALLAARPTVFLAVPRVWEKFRAALEARLAEAKGLKGAIVRWSRGVGLRAGGMRMEHGQPRGLLALEETIARKLFFSKLASQLGLERLRMAATGAAPVGKDVLEFFLSCGIAIQEVYGQSEGTGVATYNVNKPGQIRLGTVGRPVPGAEVKLAPDGEIIVKSPAVFLGYFKDEASTKACVIDGWLHSGDIGEFDANGFLRITDRKKDLIVTSGGKNVAPQNIEKLLRTIDGVSQAVVIGDRRNYLTAILTLDAEASTSLAKTKGWPEARVELCAHEDFVAHVQAGVDRINAQIARYENVRKFRIVPNDFTVETGELTPTQKIKRKAVTERYQREIEAMYAQSEGQASAPSA
jgi:long-chain acyl-CoA synthetase